jgi:hypothetical protein
VDFHLLDTVPSIHLKHNPSFHMTAIIAKFAPSSDPYAKDTCVILYVLEGSLNNPHFSVTNLFTHLSQVQTTNQGQCFSIQMTDSPTPSTLSIMAASDTETNSNGNAELVRTLSARDTVFETVELLDNILGHILAEREEYDGDILRWVFNLHRVSKTFYNHIHGDTSAAQELYMHPKQKQDGIAFLMEEEGFIKSDTTTLGRLWRVDYPLECPNGYDYLMRFCISRSEIALRVQSLGEMLLTQPPIKKIWMQGARTYSSPTLEPVLLNRPSGIKLKDVIVSAKMLLKLFGGKETVFFWARVDDEGNLLDREEGSGSGVMAD